MYKNSLLVNLLGSVLYAILAWMIKVTIGNSMSNVSGMTPIQFKQLKKIMSYNIGTQAAYYSGAWDRARYLIDNKGTFPTGLLYLLSKWLVDTKTLYKLKDTRIKPKKTCDFKLNLSVTPYPEQTASAITAYKANRGIITMPTGSGKSMAITLLINELQVPTLLVVPTLALKRQLIQTLARSFPETEVGGLGRSIAVENIDALDTKQMLEGYDAVIIDEFHHAAATTYKKLNKTCWNSVFHRYGFTATPFRSKHEERLLLESILSEVVYKLDHKTAVKKGYIVPIEVYYYDLPKRPVNGYTWAQVYSELVVNNKERNKLISLLMESLNKVQIPTLTLVKEIEHGYNINDMSAIPYAFMQGENDNNSDILHAMDSGVIYSAIGTTGVVGEGVDTRAAEYIIIAGLGKSKNAFMQQCGRGFRRFEGKESCKIIIFRDRSHKWTLTHFRAQCKIAKEEYGIIPVKLQLSTE